GERRAGVPDPGDPDHREGREDTRGEGPYAQLTILITGPRTPDLWTRGGRSTSRTSARAGGVCETLFDVPQRLSVRDLRRAYRGPPGRGDRGHQGERRDGSEF